MKLRLLIFLLPLLVAACGGRSREDVQDTSLMTPPVLTRSLPPTVDLSENFPVPGHQGNHPSCVGWAVAYALKSYHETKEERKPLVFSPTWIYNRLKGESTGGMNMEAALELVKREGVATLADMPYPPENDREPSAEVRHRAARYRIARWSRVNPRDEEAIKSFLFAGTPVLFAARTDTVFLDAPAGFIWKKHAGESLNGHAMVLVGYDDDRRAYKLMNSWGRDWCDGGFGWIDYTFFASDVKQAYVTEDAKNPPAQDEEPMVHHDNHDDEDDRPPVDHKPIVPEKPIVKRNPKEIEDDDFKRPDDGRKATIIIRPHAVANGELVITQVTQNTVFPGRPDLGHHIRFDGTLRLPPGSAATGQVLVRFYWDNGSGDKGEPVQNVTTGGDASCGTVRFAVTSNGYEARWSAWIAYQQFYLWSGRWETSGYDYTYQPAVNPLIAEAVLLENGREVAQAELVRFTLSK